MAPLTAFALGLLLIATYLLAFQRYVWDAALLFSLSVIGLLIAMRRALFPVRARAERIRHWPRWSWRVGGRLGALALSVVVGLMTRQTTVTDYTFPLILWLFAVGAFAATLILPPLRRVSLAEVRDALPRWEWIALGGLLLASGAVRLIGLGHIPANLGGDEGTQLLAGLRLIEPPLGNPFATGWYSVPTMSFFAYGLAMRLFGVGIVGGRALSALIGTLTVLTSWLLGRSLGGRRAGWWVALTVAFASYHIHYSRLASNQIIDPFVGTLATWLLWQGMHRSRSDLWRLPAWGLTGVVLGAGWYAYFGARWMTFLAALILAWRAATSPRFLARHRRGLICLMLGWLIVVLPLLAWYSTHPSTLTERYNAVSIFASGWLRSAVEVTGKSAFQALLQQFWKSISAFHLTPDPTFWYYPQMPLLDFVSGTLMVVGMLAALFRWRWPSRGLTLLWFWSTLLMAWTLTENPPSSQRGLLLAPAVALLVAWGIEALIELFHPWRKILWSAGAVMIALIIILNTGFYFGIYTPRRSYGNPTAEIATAYARFAMAHPPEGRTYFFGPPQIYWDFGALAFLLRDQPGVDVMPEETPTGVTAPARFAFVAGRTDELLQIQSRYPGGEIHRVLAPDQRILALVYDWKANEVGGDMGAPPHSKGIAGSPSAIGSWISRVYRSARSIIIFNPSQGLFGEWGL
jgi:hypothetical protein